MTGEAFGTNENSAAEPASHSVHASAVVIGEAGILIRGLSGLGKSTLARSLLRAAAQAGWFARLVGDDRIVLAGHDGRLIARGHTAILGMIEERGKGILELPYEAAVVVRLIVDLMPAKDIARYPDATETAILFCGAKLPRLTLCADQSSCDAAQAIMAHLQQPRIN